MLNYAYVVEACAVSWSSACGESELRGHLKPSPSSLNRIAIRAAGARLVFLPKYSPDLNPIEQLFAKLKTLVQKAEPRTFEATSNALAKVTPTERANYLQTQVMPSLKRRTL